MRSNLIEKDKADGFLSNLSDRDGRTLHPSNSSCSNSVQLVPLQPIVTSILFHHYKELKECISELEHIETKVYTKNKELTIKKELPTPWDSYFIKNNAFYK